MIQRLARPLAGICCNKMKRLVIIPARGGSKRIPRKNIKEFQGKPIIVRVLEEVSKSGLFDYVHVSTEDSEISEVVSRAGFAPPFRRPPELAGDFTPLSDVLQSVVAEYRAQGIIFDTIALVFATAVMLKAKTLQDAVRLYEIDGLTTTSQLISISKYPAPIEWAMRMDSSGVLSPIDKQGLLIRSQDLKSAWYETADFVLYSEAGIFTNDIHAERKGFEVTHIPVDIDTIDDWRFAEQLFNLQPIQKS